MTPDTPGNDRNARGFRRFLVPSFGDIVFLVVFSLALVLGAGLTQRDGDLAKHLQIGHTIIDEGQLPTVDIYSHTMSGGEMVPYEWLSQTILAATERLFGFDGLGILAALMAALPWAIMYRWLVGRNTPLLLAGGLALLGAAASMIHWAARPHMFTWLFVVVWVVLLEDLRRRHRTQVWVLVPLTILWVNTHGGFIVGFILTGIYLAGSVIDHLLVGIGGERNFRLSRHLAAVLVASFAVSFINPAGHRVVFHPFVHLLGDGFLFDFTREFNSPDFHNPFFWPFLAMLLLSVFLSFRWNATTLILAVFWTASGLYAFRNIPLYALVLTPLLASAIVPWLQREPSTRLGTWWRDMTAFESQVFGGTLAAIVVAFAVLTMARAPGSAYQFGSPVFPEQALSVIGADPPGERVFNQFAWGGYLVYCCHPEIPVFIDGQTDYYGPELTMQYDEAIRGLPEWRDVFVEHGIDWVLISPDTGLAQVLAESSEWEEIYRDATTVAYTRST